MDIEMRKKSWAAINKKEVKMKCVIMEPWDRIIQTGAKRNVFYCDNV